MTQEYQYKDDFLIGGEENYGNVPSGEFIPRGNIGLAQTFRAWGLTLGKSASFDDEGEYTNGKPRRVSFSTTGIRLWLRGGTKEKANEYVKHYLGDTRFVTPTYVTTMATASVTNMTDETRAKFSTTISGECEVVGLPKDYQNAKNAAGLSLVAIPSVVNAYALGRGWYQDSLFDLSLVSDREVHSDTKEQIEKLVEQRKVLWAALGEKAENWRVNAPDKLESKKLVEAIARLVNADWGPVWLRMQTVFNPSPGSYYTQEKDVDGKTVTVSKRNYVQTIIEFFKNEREAQEIGMKELAAQSDSGTTENGSDTPDLFDALSDGAKKQYGNSSTFASLIGDIRQSIASGKAKKLVMSEWQLTEEDFELLK